MKCLVTAIGSMSAEAVIHSIERMSPGSVIGCNSHPRTWTPASRLVRCFHQVPPASASDYVTKILEICIENAITHIVPLTDPEVDALAENGPALIEAGIVLCMSPPAAIRTARDKWAAHQTFQSHSTIKPIPTCLLEIGAAPSFGLPMLAKPRTGRSSEGLVRIPDAASLAYWTRALDGRGYVLQPQLEGDVLVVDAIRCGDARGQVAMTRQELLRTPNGAGLTVRMRPGHRCGAVALDIAGKLDLSGCFNVEFLEVDGTAYLMDINPRFSAGVAFSHKAGYDMAANHVRCFIGEPIDPCSQPPDTIYARGYSEYQIREDA